MPYPIVSDNYPDAWISNAKFNVSELAISYSRSNINIKLQNALCRNCVYYDNNKQPTLFSASELAQDYVATRTKLEKASGKDRADLEKRIADIVNQYPELDDEDRYSLAIAYA